MIKLIIIEDSDALRTLLRSMLSNIAGLSIVNEFNSSSTAIKAIRANPPDLVLLDVHLSEGRGIDVINMISNEFPEIKVLIVSNFADRICRDTFNQAGAFAFFDKSFQLAAMYSTLEQLVNTTFPRAEKMTFKGSNFIPELRSLKEASSTYYTI